MQLSECYRRAILLPKSDLSDANAARNSVDKDDQFEILSMEESQFYSLWNDGVFEVISEQCGILLDDYEEAELSFSQADNAIKALNEKMKAVETRSLIFIGDLQRLLRLSLLTKRSLYFVF